MNKEKKKIDWMITLVPLAIVVGLSVLFWRCQNMVTSYLESRVKNQNIRFFLGDA